MPPEIYQVALSFAGEDRTYVRSVASALSGRSIRVFYDEEEETELWGRDLTEELPRIYGQDSNLVVLFISEAYAEKAYPRLERKSALARAINERREYVLPARFDDTEIPGLLGTVSYIDLRQKTPEAFADMIATKIVALGGRVPVATEQLAAVRAQPGKLDGHLEVTTRNREGEAIEGVTVLAVARNGTRIAGHTNADGTAQLALPFRRNTTLYAAHEGYAPGVIRDLDPVEDVTLTLEQDQGVGSLVIADGTGHIPGLAGRLNPIHDTGARRYLYASNISINETATQPVPFELGAPLELEDSAGQRFVVTFIDSLGSSSLIHYRRLDD